MIEAQALDVVIVSYRCRELLRDCLRSLSSLAPGRPTTVFVVDNASDDGTKEMVRADFPDVQLIALDENVGFSAASNLAIRRGDGEFVLALNPDTRVTFGGIDQLIATADAHRQIGVCGPRLVRDDGSFDHAAKRSFPSPLSALGHFTGIGRRAKATGRLADYRAPSVAAGPVDAVSGAFMLMRRAALEEVGLFDEGYWMYMEDLDLCYRFAQAGWVTWYEPAVSVVHVKHGSSGRHRTTRVNYAFHYGMYRFYRKHYAAERSRLLNGLVYTGIGGKLAISIIRSAMARRGLGRGGSAPAARARA